MQLQRVRTLARIGVGAALIFATSWALALLPNIKLTFLLAATFGLLWGGLVGFSVGALGTFLWSLFNPYGPALPPIMAAQVISMGLVGASGMLLRPLLIGTAPRIGSLLVVGLIGSAGTLVYFVVVNLVDAWLFQPFLPRFLSGMLWSLWPIGLNAILFPVSLPLVSQSVRPARAD